MGESKNVYYHILEGNCYAFADERTKKKLLDLICAAQREAGWTVYAFCVADDGAHFVTESESLIQINTDFAHIADLFRQECRRTLPDWWGEAVDIRIGEGKQLCTEREIVECCRRIHLLPLERSYVEHPGDYWWSSYVTYTDCYRWELVSCTRVLQYFSSDEAKAHHALRRYHKETVTPCDFYNDSEIEM